MGELYFEPITPEEEAELWFASPSLDANQQPAFERALERLLTANPNTDDYELKVQAAEIARAELASADVVARRIAAMRQGPSYCYLAFHGVGESALFVKVGMSRHPERRLYEMATGNPLDCLWAFVSKAVDSRAAYQVEQAILRELSGHKRRGEWISLGAGMGQAEAAKLANSMTGIAKAVESDAGDFEVFTYRDGRVAA